MSGRPRRAAAQRAREVTDSKEEAAADLLDASDEEEPPRKRRASRGRQTEPDKDDDYDPDANDGGEGGGDKELDADGDAGGGEEAGGRRKRARAAPAPSRRRSAPTHAGPSSAAPRAVKLEADADGDGGADDGEGPIAVSDVAFHRAEGKILAYHNAAEAASTSMPRGPGMTQQGLDLLVRLVVRHVIFANSERPGVPVSRSEVTRMVSEAAGTASKRAGLPSLVIAVAQARLAAHFGLEMVELTKPPARARDKGPAAPGEGTKHFVLRSLVPPALYAAAVEPPGAAAERGFLGVILSMLEMAGGSMADEELWKHLGGLGVARDAGDHPALGPPAAVMDGFLRRRQLAAERVQGADGMEIVYSIGENAAEELGPDRLRRFYEGEFGDGAL